MNTSPSQALHLSRQAQAALLFLSVLMGAFFPATAYAQLKSALPDAPAALPASLPYRMLSDKPPPFSTGKVIGQVAIGSIAGLGAGVVGGFIGVAIEDCHDGDWLCGLSGALLGVSAGVIVGSSVGVYVMGRTEMVEISYGRTLAGSAAGFGGGVLLLGVLGGGDNELAFITLLISPAVGATLLGNTSRRYRAGHGPSALLNWDEGQLHLGVPALQQQRLGGVPHTVVRSVRLLEIRW